MRPGTAGPVDIAMITTLPFPSALEVKPDVGVIVFSQLVALFEAQEGRSSSVSSALTPNDETDEQRPSSRPPSLARVADGGLDASIDATMGPTDTASAAIQIPPCGDPRIARWPDDPAPIGDAYATFDACQRDSPDAPLPHFVASAPFFARVCWRVAAESRSGWRIGAELEGRFDGFIAEPGGWVDFEVIGLSEMGRVDRSIVHVEAQGPQTVFELPGAPTAIDAFPSSGLIVATADRLFVGEDVYPIARIAALSSLAAFPALAWIERDGTEAVLVVAAMDALENPESQSRIVLDGDASEGVAIASDGFRTVAALVGAELLLIDVARSTPSAILTVAARRTVVPPATLLPVIEFAVVGTAAGVIAVYDEETLEPLPIDPDLASADMFVPSIYRADWWRPMARLGDRLVPVTAYGGTVHAERAYVGTVEVNLDVPLDPRVGVPIAVTTDGRVRGTLGIAGVAHPESPTFVAAEISYGGEPILWGFTGDDIGFEPIVVRRGDRYFVVRAAGDFDDSCTI